MSLRISLVHQFAQQQAETEDLCFAFDGKKLVSSDRNALYFWQLTEHGTWVYERSLPFRHAGQLTFAVDGKWLAFHDPEEIVYLIDLEGEAKEIKLPAPARTSGAFSLDQHWLVSGGMGRQILLWDLFAQQCSAIDLPISEFPWSENGRTKQPEDVIENICFTPDGQRLAIGMANAEGQGYIYICRFDPTHKDLRRQETLPHGCLDLAISPDGTMLATIEVLTADGPVRQEIYVYDLNSFQLLHVFPQKGEDGYCLLAFSPESRYLMCCTENGMIDMFSLTTFEPLLSFAAHPGLAVEAMDSVGGLDWSRTGYIATGGASVFEEDSNKEDYTIKIWKIEDEETREM
jgi:WD40 repeat protein